MTDWQHMDVPTFDRLVNDGEPASSVSLGVLDRLPFTFDSKAQYLRWRDDLAADLGLDSRDIALVGSAASGRSLSARKQFSTFHQNSDLDIAVISHHHFDISWRWFRITNTNFVTGLDPLGRELFERHRQHYIYEGVVAADYFLSYLPFGPDWLAAMQRSERNLPSHLQGRLMKVRIYRDYSALRAAQTEAMRSFKRYIDNKFENKAAQREVESDQDEAPK